jgi:hypothetical protein
MSIHIELYQERNVLEGPIFQVINTITYITGLDRNIFVYETETGLYSHVATVWDMNQWPVSQYAAQQESKDYYREDNATLEYPVATIASDAADYLTERVQFLAAQSEIVDTEFSGSETIVIDEGGE